jgi:hypothetical protein
MPDTSIPMIRGSFSFLLISAIARPMRKISASEVNIKISSYVAKKAGASCDVKSQKSSA